MSEWINVESQLPPIGEKVLIYYKWAGENKHSIAFDKVGITNPNSSSVHWLGKRNGRITYWMPLPDPPEEI